MRDAAELRDHRGQVVLPHVGQQAQRRGGAFGVALDLRGAALRHRIDEAQHVAQHLHGGIERVLEQVFLGVDQPVLLDAVLDDAEQGFRVAGLEQEAEYAALVDGGDGGFEVGLAA